MKLGDWLGLVEVLLHISAAAQRYMVMFAGKHPFLLASHFSEMSLLLIACNAHIRFGRSQFEVQY